MLRSSPVLKLVCVVLAASAVQRPSNASGQEDSTPEAPPDAPFTYGPDGRDISYEVPTIMVRVRTPTPQHRLHLLVREEVEAIPFRDAYPLAPSLRPNGEDPNAFTPFYTSPPHHLRRRRSTIEVCAGQCFVPLGAGLTYRFVVYVTDGSTRMWINRSRSVTVTERTVGLTVGYADRRVQRRRRAISVAVVAVAGGVMMALAPSHHERWCERRPESCSGRERNLALFATGAVFVASPLVTFLLPTLTGDGPVIDVIERDERVEDQRAVDEE